MAIVRRFSGQQGSLEWEGVPVQKYEDDAVGASRRVLIGADDGTQHYELRYFEVQPGGRTSFDEHPHDHGVYVLRGRGRVLLGNEVVEIGPGDVIYIPPWEKHQFFTTSADPLGFLCVAPPRSVVSGQWPVASDHGDTGVPANR